MLPNNLRLRSSQRIGEIFKKGKYTHGKFLLIKYLPNQEERAQVAISVGIKLFKQATKRNRIKRLIREAVKKNLTKLPKQDILIIAKPNIDISISLKELQTDLGTVLKQVIPSLK